MWQLLICKPENCPLKARIIMPKIINNYKTIKSNSDEPSCFKN